MAEEINPHTRPESISTCLCFLLVEFSSDLVDLALHSFSKGFRLRSSADSQTHGQRTYLLGSVPVVDSRLFLLPVDPVLSEQDL